MSLACEIVAQLMLMALPNGREAAVTQGWIDPIIGQSGRRPESGLVAYHDGALVGSALSELHKREPQTDCSTELQTAGARIGPWPEGGDRPGETPDGNPAICFTNVTLSLNRRLALVAWAYFYGPLGAGYHYAVLKREANQWALVSDRRYGPVS